MRTSFPKAKRRMVEYSVTEDMFLFSTVRRPAKVGMLNRGHMSLRIERRDKHARSVF